MSDDLLDRAKQALDGVTDGPWRASLLDGIDYEDGSSCVRGGIYPAECGSAPVLLVPAGIDRRDARFIAAARTLVPEMAAEIERFRTIEHNPALCFHCTRCADADDSQQEAIARAAE